MVSDDEGVVPVRCGEIVAERYRVERLLGIGGMGTVVAARHLSLGELVAIKFMRAEYCGNPLLLRRFQREARGMFRLKTEHVPRVFDLGTLAPRPGAAQPVPFIVMEHLSGNDLRSIVERRGRLPVAEAAEYVRQACSAVMEAHALGMVHRDIKPANLFLTYRTDGTPLIKVLDFGVAKFTSARPEEDGLEMTTARSVMGSRRYMAPEQMLTPKDVDLRADIWALGVVLYQLVSGTLPFGAETLEQLVLVVTEQPPRPLRSVCPDLPDGFDEIVMRCLEKDRRRRPASASELAAALAPFALREPPDATLPTAVHRSEPTFTWQDERPPTTVEARPAEAKRLEHRRPRRAWLTGAVGAVAACTALLGIVVPSGGARAPGAPWAHGAGAQHRSGVLQGLAAEPPLVTAAGPLEAHHDALAPDGVQHATDSTPPAGAGHAPLVACDPAGLRGLVRTTPRAAAEQAQCDPGAPPRPMGMPGGKAPRRAPSQRKEAAARPGDAPSPPAAAQLAQKRPSPAAAEAPTASAPPAPGAAHAAAPEAPAAAPAAPDAAAVPTAPAAAEAPTAPTAAEAPTAPAAAAAPTALVVPDSPW